MPNDTPRHRVSPIPPHPSRRSEAHHLGQTHPAPPPRDLRDPRARATLCYALPLAPALYLLARERGNRFIRMHAAQALIFFVGVGFMQALLFALVVILGNATAGSRAELPVSLALWGALIALGLAALTLWLRLLADAGRGRLRWRPILTPLAAWLEPLFANRAPPASNAGRARRNTAGGSAAPTEPGPWE